MLGKGICLVFYMQARVKKICGEGCRRRRRGRGEGGDIKRCCVSGQGALV